MERFLWELIIWNSALLKVEFQAAGWWWLQVTLPWSPCCVLEGHILGRHWAANSGPPMGGSPVHVSPWSRTVSWGHKSRVTLSSATISCVTLDKLLNLLLVSFLHWKMRTKIVPTAGIVMRIKWVHVHEMPRIGQACDWCYNVYLLSKDPS